MRRVKAAERALLEARVQLDLVDRRRNPGLADNPFEMFGAEIGDADRAREPLLAQSDHGPPGLDIEPAVRRRPMHEIEIEIFELQPRQAVARRAQRRVEAVRVVPEFCGDERLGAGDAAARQALPDAGLVAVSRGGVDMAIAGLQRRLDDVGGRAGRRLPDAEPELGNRPAVIERHLHADLFRSGGVASSTKPAMAASKPSALCAFEPSRRTDTVRSAASRLPTAMITGVLVSECSRTL